MARNWNTPSAEPQCAGSPLVVVEARAFVGYCVSGKSATVHPQSRSPAVVRTMPDSDAGCGSEKFSPPSPLLSLTSSSPAVSVTTCDCGAVAVPALAVRVYVPGGTFSIRYCPHSPDGTLAVVTVYVDVPELRETVASPSRLPAQPPAPACLTHPATVAVADFIRTDMLPLASKVVPR